jgi:hypothetical protein
MPSSAWLTPRCECPPSHTHHVWLGTMCRAESAAAGILCSGAQLRSEHSYRRQHCRRLCDSGVLQEALQAANETAASKKGEIKQMEGAVQKYRQVLLDIRADAVNSSLSCLSATGWHLCSCTRGWLAGCRAQAERAQQAEAAAQAEVTRLEGALREVRGRVEQRRGDLNSQQTQGAVVKALLQARDHGEIDGIHGRLGACCTSLRAGWLAGCSGV